MTRHGDCWEMCGTIEDPFLQTVHPSYHHSIHEFAASKLSSVICHVVVVVLLYCCIVVNIVVLLLCCVALLLLLLVVVLLFLFLSLCCVRFDDSEK